MVGRALRQNHVCAFALAFHSDGIIPYILIQVWNCQFCKFKGLLV